MKKTMCSVALLFSAAFVYQAAMAESTPQLVSTHSDWSVYTFNEDDNKVCFMSSQPANQEGDYSKRGEVFMFITHWSNDSEKNVVSISNGYSFKEDSSVSVKVDDKNFKMFTQGEMAWTKDADTDNEMTASIKKGSNIVVEGVSKYGTHTKDTYSLKGSGDAYRAMLAACK